MIALIVYGLQMVVVLAPLLASFVQYKALVILLQSILAALLIILVGEFIPKTIVRINPNLSLKVCAIPLFLVYIILFPIAILFSYLSFGILRLIGVRDIKRTSPYVLGKVDLDSFIQQTIDDAPQNATMDTEVKIFQNALDFSNVRLRDCIVPRTEIVACDTAMSITDLRMKFIETGLSKIVVFKDNIDDVIGYVHSSELFKHPEDWTQQINPVSIVPETMAANKLMKQLMQEKRSLAVVVDEFGGTAGIVTLEDIVEEIFGEIEDEHDLKSRVAKKVSDNTYFLSGRMEIDMLNDMFELDLPESDEYVTIAGFILHHYQKFPKLNEIVEIDGFSFKIIKVTSTKIELVRLSVIE